MAQIFRRVIIVTTGSGIGPCLGTMTRIPGTECRVIWSVPSPRERFSNAVVDEVLKINPNAIIIDTQDKRGRRDLKVLAYRLYVEESAEAVFCVSNKGLTKQLIYEMESRDVPAFGPVWDSWVA